MQAIDSPQLTEALRKGALRVLCKLCGLSQLLPTGCVLGHELVETETRIGRGGFADVWQGTYRGTQVAIKQLHVHEKDDFTKIYKVSDLALQECYSKDLQRFCKEVVIWRRLSHPNILPLLGVSTNGHALRMVSNLMSHGNIMEYLRIWPSANRLLLVSSTPPYFCTPSK